MGTSAVEIETPVIKRKYFLKQILNLKICNLSIILTAKCRCVHVRYLKVSDLALNNLSTVRDDRVNIPKVRNCRLTRIHVILMKANKNRNIALAFIVLLIAHTA